MKRRILIMGVVALMLVLLLAVASTGLVDTGIVRAQDGDRNVIGTFDNEEPLAPNLTLTLTPYNPPNVIPASGGTFQYLIDVKNNKEKTVRFDVWTSLTLPDGSSVSPANGPFRARIPGGWSVNRDNLTQMISANDPPGTYTYNAHVGLFPDTILVTESFTFDKLEAVGWFPQSSGTSDWLFDIHFADANNGWAVGQTNEIVHTTNGGDTWAPQSTPIFSNFWTVFAVDAQNAWVGGSGAVLLHTSDGGATWVQQNQGASAVYAWEGIFFLDANNGWVVGGKPYDFMPSRRVIIHTTDGGATWETQYSMSNETPLNAVYFADANNGWAVGDGSGILHTSDGGATWVGQTSGTYDYFEDVFFTDANKGWAVGRDGIVAYTTDGGATWNVQYLSSDYDLAGIHFANQNMGWISGIDHTTSTAIILCTSDGGATWNNQDPGPATILFDIVFVDANNGWAAGDNGTIVHTDSGGE